MNPRILLFSLLMQMCAYSLLACPTQAHNFWMEPAQFQWSGSAPLPVRMLVGHPGDKEPWGIRQERIVAIRSLGPTGLVDQRPAFPEGVTDGRISVSLPEPGLHLLMLESHNSDSVLDPEKFNAYLEKEGLTLIRQDRERNGTGNQPGSEIYSRRAKALIRVGGLDSGIDPTRPVGQTLEVVPDRNPYALRPDEPLTARIFYQGKPLPGALATLYQIRGGEAKEAPDASQRSDADGRVSFAIPKQGAWQINVIWGRPIAQHKRAKYETVFSSLTFGFD